MRYILLNTLIILQIWCVGQDIECDRPDQGETPAIVPAGAFQMESGFSFQYTDRATQTMVHPISLLKYGLGNIGEVRLEVESTTERSISERGTEYQSGLTPINFGAKLKVCEEYKARPRISVIIMTSIPILASGNFQEEYPAPEVRLAMQHSFSEKIKLGYNLGIYLDSENFMPVELYTVSGQFTLSEKFECFIETYGFIPSKGQHNHHMDGGFMFKPSKTVMIDLNAGIDLHSHPGWFCGTGLSFRIGKPS
jgi:hypothetical protein